MSETGIAIVELLSRKPERYRCRIPDLDSGSMSLLFIGEMNDEWNVKMYSLIKKRVIGKS